MRPLPSCSVAKLALPMTRFSIMRPATDAGAFSGSSSCFVFSPNLRWRSAAKSLRRKSFGKAPPFARSAFSFSRRSSMSLLSSSMFADKGLNPLLQARGDEVVELAVEHALGVALLDAGPQVLDARLV